MNKMETKIKNKNNTIYNHCKGKKYLGIILTKYVKYIYAEN